METRKPFDDFYYVVKERLISGVIGSRVYGIPIRYEWVRDHMCQNLSAKLFANGAHSFGLGVVMLCRNFGKPNVYNAAQIAVIERFYNDDDLIRRIIDGIYEKKKVWGAGKKLSITFFLEREGMATVKSVTHVSVDDEVYYQEGSDALSIADTLRWIEESTLTALGLICNKDLVAQ